MVIVTEQQLQRNKFLNHVDLELKRAERYSIFLSLLLFDLSKIIKDLSSDSEEIVQKIAEDVSRQVREIDKASLIDNDKLALLFPETNRQGAEIVSKRVIETIKAHINDIIEQKLTAVITPEMVSYPDAAGAKSFKEFILEYKESMTN